MSGFGGFGGFGQSNQNQQQSTGFGGFGGNNTTNTGFGSTGNTGFGATNTTGGGLFGGGGTTGGFGSTGGAFGSNTTGAFGAKPSGFGTTTATTGGGLFGSNTATAGTSGFGGGGFGSAATSSPFGGGTTGGSLFGASKPAFGGTTSTPFGGGTTSAFGGGATTNAFGAPASTALGAGPGECQGTGSVPFQAFVEKEPNSNTNQQNAFQNISFQAPYQKFSPEELRLADYNSGRRYGNASGQAGAFGQTNFGGFGSTGTGFGATNTTTGGTGLFGGGTSTGFGATQQPASTGFGSTTATTGGLFGAKPATTGGLFGAQPAAQTGGLFGGGGSTGGFGSTNTGGFGQTNTNTGGGLFGNTGAAKPFSFGTSQPAATGGFGAPAATTGSAFGGGGGLFGNTQAQQNTSTPFGTQQPAAANNPFGGFGANTQQQQNTGTSSLFGGANQQKPATGLFGAAPAATGTGGLFGSTQPAATGGGLFGGAANTQQTGGLFGAKPATTGTGLFGSTNTQTNTGGGLFGGGGFGAQNQNQQQQNTGGLFGSLNNNNQQKPSLFGSTNTQQQGGNSLFGGSTGTQQQPGMFGSMNNNQQQQQQPQNSLFGGSFLGGSQQGQQTPQSFNASLTDAGAYGQASLFQGLANGSINNPGPIATPLSSTPRAKTSAALPMYRLNSASTSRFSTPQQKRGYGFSYSTYASPGSASSTASTPGTGTFSGSLLSGGSFGRSLSKSMSTSSLRRSFNAEDSILAPGAFSASPNIRHFGSTGSSVKKLTISRSIRQDLFSPPNPPAEKEKASTSSLSNSLKKRVSFSAETSQNNGNGTHGSGSSSPLKQMSSSTPDAQDLGYMRPKSSTNGAPNGSSSQPEMEQVPNANNQLAIVTEEEPNAVQPPASGSAGALQKGDYYSSPTIQELKAMNRTQLSKLSNFVVGRKEMAHIEFLQPVDLTGIDLDNMFGGVIVLVARQATVYPDESRKPPMGKGLNVPSKISLWESWPRSKAGESNKSPVMTPKLKKHIERLRRIENTEFINYDMAHGVWTFKVPHYTTYGLPDEEDETDADMSEFGQSTLSAPPDTTPRRPTPKSIQMDESFASTEYTENESGVDDTFEFRKRKLLPGAFDEQDMYVDEEMDVYDSEGQQSFLDERSAGSPLSEVGVEEPMDQDDVYQDDESVSIRDHEMVGSFPQVDDTAEPEEDSQYEDDDMMGTSGALVRARARAQNAGTPRKFTVGDDWTRTLTTTISPKKQDRALLKSLIELHGNDSPTPAAAPVPVARRVVSDGRGFNSAIDIMQSLFESRSPAKKAKIPATGKGFEWPYAKRPKTADNDISNMSEKDRAFHNSLKPSWGPDGSLVYSGQPNLQPSRPSSRHAREPNGLLTTAKGGIVSENRDVRFAKFSNEASANFLKKQKDMTVVDVTDGVPLAGLRKGIIFSNFVDEGNPRDPAAAHEKLIWQLLGIVYEQDPRQIDPILNDVPDIANRFKMINLSAFWEKLVEDTTNKHVALAKSDEEKAVACLAGHRIAEACGYLMNSKNYHLATLVARIGNDKMKKDMREQLKDWRNSKMLSEFTQPIRAIYELLAGNVCICEGSKGNGVEDRVDSFVISKRFGLDWRQALGLRLWYGGSSTDFFDAHVEDFVDDLVQDKETARPIPWYVEQKVPALWEDKEVKNREDLLFGVLRLATFEDASLEDIINPENSQLSPLDVRLSWQLSQAITHAHVLAYSEDSEEKADRTTLAFAAQLTTEGSWLDAVFVLLHLNSVDARVKSIQDHLARHAGRIGNEDSQSFVSLTQNLKIPTSWIWEVKALYMRSVEKNPRAEVECLIHAKSFNEAHRTFAREVAPKAVIELDYDTLRALLQGFAGKESTISEWHLGGEIYQDFLELLDSDRKSHPIDNLVLERLLSGLPHVVAESRHPGFMETVAIETISGVVAKAVVTMGKRGEKSNLNKILRLPLTEDKYLKHTVELSLEYYRGVMAGLAK